MSSGNQVVTHVRLTTPHLVATNAEVDALDVWSDTGAYLADVWDVYTTLDHSLLDGDLYNNCSGDLMQEDSGAEYATQLAPLLIGDLPDDAVCYICLDPITLAEPLNIQKLSCNHWFHAKCLRPWAARENTCPTCRTHSQPSF